MAGLLLNSKFRPIIEATGGAGDGTTRPVYYKSVANSNNAYDLATRFLFECGVKLRSKPVVVAVAAQIYHQFYAAAVDNSYDPFLIASTCLYVASKQEDDPLKIRDLINVVYRTLNRDSDVLELGEDYWNHRDSIVQAELLVMRLISFRMPSPKSHLYLLTYLRTLQSWIPADTFQKTNLVKTCWTLLQDLHHSKAIIQFEPQVIALSVIHLALQIYGVVIPCTNEGDPRTWHEVFYSEARKEVLWSVVEMLITVYEKDKDLV